MKTLDTSAISGIIGIILQAFPNAQGIYLFGSFATGDANADSDVDIAVLLSHAQAKQVGSLALTSVHLQLGQQLRRSVDLINLRRVSTVLQKQVIANGKLIDCQDDYAVAEFEMLVISFYQKLNEERKDILDAFWKSGKAFAV